MLIASAFIFSLHEMEPPNTLELKIPSFKQIVIQDHRAQDTTVTETSNLLDQPKCHNQTGAYDTIRVTFNNDEILIIDDKISKMSPSLSNCILWGISYCQTMPLKIIVSKCIVDWQVAREVSIVDMEIGFSLIKLTNTV